MILDYLELVIAVASIAIGIGMVRKESRGRAHTCTPEEQANS